jgi:hypothetical protein
VRTDRTRRCLVHATLNDERTCGPMNGGPDLLVLERNTRYASASPKDTPLNASVLNPPAYFATIR